MSTESIILLENTSTESADSTFAYSAKQKGAGYNKRYGGLHTYVYELDAFAGEIKLQGTLELYPGEADWVNIVGTTAGGDSTISAGITTYTGNFTGNFVWIRGVIEMDDGAVQSILYNR